LQAIEDLLEQNGSAPAELTAGAAALSSNLWFWRGHAARSLTVAKEVEVLGARSNAYFTSYALARTAMSRQMMGAEEDAVRNLDLTLQQTRLAPGAKAQLLLARAIVHLNGGHLFEVERSALALQRLAAENALQGSHSWAHYLLGRIYYEWDRPEEAAEHFLAVITSSGAEGLPLHDSYLGLALIHEGNGKTEAADEMVDALCDRFWDRDSFFVPAAASFRARQALARDLSVDALRKIRQVVIAPRQQSLSPLEIPALTHVRVLIAHNTVASLEEALNLLRTMQRTASMGYNRLRAVEVLALRALALEALGETETARDALQQALIAGERGGMVRVFTDLGPPMAALLYRLAGSDRARSYVGQLLASFPRAPHTVIVPDEEEVDALTDREWEVLALMGRRLSNKEIAQQLTISPHTVKKHASNIYQKLDVSSRRQAIARATQLGLLPPPSSGGPILAFA
jgi:LuxR family maltose regulon positive regulatory protein